MSQTTMGAIVDITFRGVEITDETVHFVTRCLQQMHLRRGHADAHTWVLVERREGDQVQAVVGVRASAGADIVLELGSERDPWLAVSNAIASLERKRDCVEACVH